jgi:regulator of cell morphogenesis and NO signaling
MSEHRISDAFDEDHERLDALFKSFQDLKRQDFAKAASAFESFKVGLQRHVAWEEDVLFPLWEQKTGMTAGGPTFVMRQDHLEIGDCLEAIDRKVRARDPESDREEQDLVDLLERHNMTEEQVLYPAMDRATNEEEREALFERMNDIPEERYRTSIRKI